MEFASAAKETGLRPNTGPELRVAETPEGHAHLCRLPSIAFGLREGTGGAKEARRPDPVAGGG